MIFTGLQTKASKNIEHQFDKICFYRPVGEEVNVMSLRKKPWLDFCVFNKRKYLMQKSEEVTSRVVFLELSKIGLTTRVAILSMHYFFS